MYFLTSPRHNHSDVSESGVRSGNRGQIELPSPLTKSRAEGSLGLGERLSFDDTCQTEEALPLNHLGVLIEPQELESNSQLETEDCGKEPQKQHVERTSMLLDTWLFECLAMVFSVACFVTICAILHIYDNQSRPTLAYNISFNTIVSLLATACKSALAFVIGEAIGQLKWVWFQGAGSRQLFDIQAFDSASRGPLGSLNIIFSHRGQSLVSFGAAIVMVMVAFDPFFQQVLSFPIRNTIVDNHAATAAVQRARSFIRYEDEVSFSNSVLLGIWTSDFAVQPICPSGNCSWPIFSSIGICSRCGDMTSVATVNCSIPPIYNGSPTASGICEVLLPHAYGSETYYNITPLRTNSSIELPLLTTWKLYDAYDDFLEGNLEGKDISNLTFANYSLPLAAYGYARLGFEPAQGVHVEKATECSLGLCLRDYEISVQNGHSTINNSKIDYGTVFRNQSGYCWSPGYGPTNMNSVHQLFGPPEGLEMPDFTSCLNDLSDFTDLMKIYLQNSYMYTLSYQSSTAIHLGLDEGTLSAQVLLRIENLTFEAVMTNIAASLTKLMIQDVNEHVNGTVYSSEVFISVKWPWLILPALVVIFGAVFLALTVLASRKIRAPLWKSSVLALLYHGLDSLDGEAYETAGKMEKSAESTNVHLRAPNSGDRVILESDR